MSLLRWLVNPSQSPAHPRSRLRVEALEDRSVPATLFVTGTTSADVFSLVFNRDNTVTVTGSQFADGTRLLDEYTDISVDGNGGFDVLEVTGNDNVARTVTTFNWAQDPSRASIIGIASIPINFANNAYGTHNLEPVADLKISTNDVPGNVVNIWQSRVPTTVTGNGPTTVNVGNGADGVQSIHSVVRVGNLFTGNTTLNIYDDANTEPRSALVTSHLTFFGEYGSVRQLAPAPIEFNISQTAAVTISTGTADGNFVLVARTARPVHLVGHGLMTVRVQNTDAEIFGPVHVSNARPHSTTLELRELSSTGRTVTLGGLGADRGIVYGLTPAAEITYNYADTASVDVRSSAEHGNTVNVEQTGVPTTIGSDGTLWVNAGSLGKSLQGIRGELTVTHSAGTTLYLYDVNDTLPRTATHYTWLQDSDRATITGLAPANINYTYSDTTSVNLFLSKASGNVVNLWQTGVPVNLNGSNRLTVNVGNGDYGVQDILREVSVTNTRPRGTTLFVDDGANPASSDVTVEVVNPSQSRITFLTSAPVRYFDAAMASVTIAASDAGTDFQLRQTRVPTRLLGGAASDRFAFHDPALVRSVSIDGRGGSDWLDYSASTRRAAVNLLYGYATGVANGVHGIENVIGSSRNDLLVGDDEANLLLGMDGDDRLNGGRGADILVGGLGKDNLQGGLGEDLLIGGSTTYDSTLSGQEAWISIMEEWQSLWDYDDRIDNLTTEGGFNGDNFLVWGDTVLDDNQGDTLTGDPSGAPLTLDWYFKGSGDSTAVKQSGEKISSP